MASVITLIVAHILYMAGIFYAGYLAGKKRTKKAALKLSDLIDQSK